MRRTLTFALLAALAAIALIVAPAPTHASRSTRSVGCGIWQPTSLWVDRPYIQGHAHIVGCGGGLALTLKEHTHCCGWKLASQTGQNGGPAGVSNFTRARCFHGYQRRWWQLKTRAVIVWGNPGTGHWRTVYRTLLLPCLR